MKKKIVIKRILKIGALLLAVILCTLLFQEVMLSYGKSNRGRMKGFYLEKKNSIDVVFIGASEVYCDFAPTYAYGKYGFTSYPFVTQGSTVRNYVTAVKEAVRTQHPKLLVIEINGALYDKSHLDKEAYARYFIDNVPLNRNKIEYIENRVEENKLEYYLPFIKYHGNWSSLKSDLLYAVSVPTDQLRGYTMLKGAKTKTTVRTVYWCRAEKEGELITVSICADGFLYNMCRAMVGTMIYASYGKLRPEEIPELLEKGDRRLTGPTMPPQGLYMNRVWYDGVVGELMGCQNDARRK